MTSGSPVQSSKPAPSLVAGGPFAELCRRIGGPLETPRGSGVIALVALGVAWLPLVVLAAWQGVALSADTGGASLIADLGVWARFVVGLPMLLLVGPGIARRIDPAFTELRRLVPESRRADFEAALARFQWYQTAWTPELVLLGIAWIAGWLMFRAHAVADLSAWHHLPGSDATSLARIWAAWVSLPLFQFVALRWGWRMFAWWRFLSRVSKLDLELIPTNPDGFGGLGFLGEAQSSLFLLMAPSALLFSSRIAMSVLYKGNSVDSFQAPGAALVVLAAIVMMGPVAPMMSALLRARRRGILEYGRLAQNYARAFDQKWVRGKAGDEPLLGTADIQSLADLSNSLTVVRRLSPIPFEKRHFALFAACLILPAVPPLLFVMPLGEILERLASILAR
ncbi:MAG: hypothetical protein ACRENS_10715 [Candidatus Eiseniibacteriota bacterium]